METESDSSFHIDPPKVDSYCFFPLECCNREVPGGGQAPGLDPLRLLAQLKPPSPSWLVFSLRRLDWIDPPDQWLDIVRWEANQMSLGDQPKKEVPCRAGVRTQLSEMGLWEAGEWVGGLARLDLVWRQQCRPGHGRRVRVPGIPGDRRW